MSDELCRRLIDDTTSEEVLAWLTGGSKKDLRLLGELETNAESIAFAEEIYAAGPKTVMAVEIDTNSHGQNTGKLVLELSPEKRWRERTFELAEMIAQDQGFDSEKDTGQSYLFISLD